MLICCTIASENVNFSRECKIFILSGGINKQMTVGKD